MQMLKFVNSNRVGRAASLISCHEKFCWWVIFVVVLTFNCHVGTSMCGTTAGWRGQTCPRDMEAGRLWTLLPRKQARAPSAVAPPPSVPSARARSSSNMTHHLSLQRWAHPSPSAGTSQTLHHSYHLFLQRKIPEIWASCGCVMPDGLFCNQVNSDKIYWQKNLDGTFTQIYSEKKAIGHFVSTKAVGSDERADITHLYKHQEGKPRCNMLLLHRSNCCPVLQLSATIYFLLIGGLCHPGWSVLILFDTIRFWGGAYLCGDRQSLWQQAKHLLLAHRGGR